MTQKKSANIRTVIIIFASLALIVIAGIGMSFYHLTIVRWWLPLTIALVAAMMLWPLMQNLWGRISFLRNIWLRAAVHAVTTTLIIWTGLLTLNSIGAEDTSVKTEKAVVQRMLRYERKETRRSGRRRITTGRVRYEHRAEVLFPEEHALKELHVTALQSQRLRKGMTIDVEVRHGLLGWPVFSYSLKD